MNKKELAEVKDKLVREYWTEDYHYGLKELDDANASQIVESMEDEDINFRVNNRKWQEDYIADYLEYLWEISEDSFWRHVKTTFTETTGLLFSDNMFYAEILSQEEIPDDVLQIIVRFIANCPEGEEHDLGLLGCILKYQVESNEILPEITKHISMLDKSQRVVAEKRLVEMLKSRCEYL